MRGLVEAYRQALLDKKHFAEVCQRLSQYFPSIQNLRILDVGCGVKTSQTALFQAAGINITGIDLDPAIIPSARSLGKRLYWAIYHTTLTYGLKTRLNLNHLSLSQANIYDLPFADETFDVAISNAVFEHLPDITQALRSLSRVMRPNGLFHIGIHLWPSLSGSHLEQAKWHPLRANDWPTHVPLWFHLRNLPPFDAAAPGLGYQHQFINRLREADYRTAFERETNLVDWIRLYHEGQEMLTDDLRRELSGYTEEDLTLRSIRVLARKRA